MNPSIADIDRGAKLLRDGNLVAFPTETVYGLGADATNDAAVRKIFAAKGRPANNPLIVHVANVDAAKRCVADWPDAADRLTNAFWPGPLTLVLPKATCIANVVTAGGPTVGVRMPNHPLALALLRAIDRPVAAPSANSSERISPTTALHVRLDLGDKVDLVLDGGPCTVGIESTVLDLSVAPPMVLRPGGVTRSQIEAVIGPVNLPITMTEPHARSPGRATRHYAPRTPAYRFEAGTMRTTPAGAVSMSLNPATAVMPNDPDQYAAQLYDTLRQLDGTGATAIYIELPPDEPRWLAIRDRLMRAAKPVGGDDIACPMCGYSLRGLAEPRCPECGFAFEWAELREAARNKHPYLFEHGTGHNLRTFWLTFWRDGRPQKFWRELSPAHPVRLRRLIIYWIISSFGLLIVVPFVVIPEAVQRANRNAAMRIGLAHLQMQFKTRPNLYPGLNLPTLLRVQLSYPPATSLAFWRTLFTHFQFNPSQLTALFLETSWIGVTLLTLMIFQQSMRRKNIRNAHLIRVAVYCCDYPALMTIAIGFALLSRNYGVLIVIAVLFSLTLYRLYFAYTRYLRLRFPLLTVLAAQTIVTLIMIVVVLNFTREGSSWLPLRF